MKLNYKVFGEGPPVFILHGLMGMLDNWQVQAKWLSEHFTAIIVDLRNHGHSPHAPSHTYDDMAEDLRELQQDLGYRTAHWLGHSMGGKAAMNFAQRFPTRVDKLVVVDIGPRYYPVHHQLVLAAIRAVPLATLVKRTDAEPHLAHFLSDSPTRQFLMKNLYYDEHGAFQWRFNAAAIESQIEHVGQAIQVKRFVGETLFVRGGASTYVADADWPEMQRWFPASRLVTVDGAGHWVHADKPNEFFQIVSSFLGS